MWFWIFCTKILVKKRVFRSQIRAEFDRKSRVFFKFFCRNLLVFDSGKHVFWLIYSHRKPKITSRWGQSLISNGRGGFRRQLMVVTKQMYFCTKFQKMQRKSKILNSFCFPATKRRHGSKPTNSWDESKGTTWIIFYSTAHCLNAMNWLGECSWRHFSSRHWLKSKVIKTNLKNLAFKGPIWGLLEISRTLVFDAATRGIKPFSIQNGWKMSFKIFHSVYKKACTPTFFSHPSTWSNGALI